MHRGSSIFTILTAGVTGSIAQAQEVQQGSSPFDAFVRVLEGSGFYKRYICQWPAPLNNASFDAVLILVLIAFGIAFAVKAVIGYMWHKKVVEANQRLRQNRKDADRLILEYGRYKMLQEEGSEGLSFKEWLDKKNVEDGTDFAPALDKDQREAVEETERGVFGRIRQTIEERREDREIDKRLEEEEAQERRIAEQIERERKASEEKKSTQEQKEPAEDVPVSIPRRETAPAKQPESAEDIRARFQTAPPASELVDLPDEEAVSISSDSIVKALERKEEEKPREAQKKETVDVGKLLAEKIQEAEEEKPAIPAEELDDFEALIQTLEIQRQTNEKAKEIEETRAKVVASNMEILQSDIEEAYSGNDAEQAKVRKDESDGAVEAAKKRALKEMQREKIRQEKRKK